MLSMKTTTDYVFSFEPDTIIYIPYKNNDKHVPPR